MKTRFLKAIRLMVLMAALFVAVPNQSRAGIILIPLGIGTEMAAFGAVSLSLGAAVVTGTASYVATENLSVRERKQFLGGFVGLGALLIVLDESASSHNVTENALSTAYPFIEDRAVIADLARMISEKGERTQADENGIRTVSLSRAEIEEVLAPTDLMDLEESRAQVEAMIRDFE